MFIAFIFPKRGTANAPAAKAKLLQVVSDGSVEPLSGRATLRLAAGDRLRIETPGGGGYGPPPGA